MDNKTSNDRPARRSPGRRPKPRTNNSKNYAGASRRAPVPPEDPRNKETVASVAKAAEAEAETSGGTGARREAPA